MNLLQATKTLSSKEEMKQPTENFDQVFSHLHSSTNILQKLNPHQDAKPQRNSLLCEHEGALSIRL